MVTLNLTLTTLFTTFFNQFNMLMQKYLLRVVYYANKVTVTFSIVAVLSLTRLFNDIMSSLPAFLCWSNWEKEKPSESIVCMGKQQPRFYWSCLSVVMKYATPLTPQAHERNSIFKCKQHTIHDPWGPEKYNYTMMNNTIFLLQSHDCYLSWVTCVNSRDIIIYVIYSTICHCKLRSLMTVFILLLKW